MLDPPGPPRAQVLQKQKKDQSSSAEPIRQAAAAALPIPANNQQPSVEQSPSQPKTKGIAIISRYPNSADDGAKSGQNLIGSTNEGCSPSMAPRIVHDSTKPAPKRVQPAVPEVNTPPLPVLPAKPLQCNEVSSSDDETKTPPPPVPRRPLANHGRKSLSRELAALQQDHDEVRPHVVLRVFFINV